MAMPFFRGRPDGWCPRVSLLKPSRKRTTEKKNLFSWVSSAESGEHLEVIQLCGLPPKWATQQGSLHYTPEHCLGNGGFPVLWWKTPCFKWGKMYLLREPCTSTTVPQKEKNSAILAQALNVPRDRRSTVSCPSESKSAKRLSAKLGASPFSSSFSSTDGPNPI